MATLFPFVLSVTVQYLTVGRCWGNLINNIISKKINQNIQNNRNELGSLFTKSVYVDLKQWTQKSEHMVFEFEQWICLGSKKKKKKKIQIWIQIFLNSVFSIEKRLKLKIRILLSFQILFLFLENKYDNFSTIKKKNTLFSNSKNKSK